MVRRAKAILLTFIAVVAALSLYAGAATEDARVYDKAGMLTSDEVSQLESYISELRSETGYDFVFLTDTDVAYNSDYNEANRADIAHADDFYDYGGFGDSSNGNSGIIFYLDMANRNPVIETTGEMIDIINDARLSDLFDTVYSYLGNEDYYGAAYSMFAQTKQYIDEGVVNGQYRYDAGSDGVDQSDNYNGIIQPTYLRELTGTDILVALGVGLAVALIYYGTVTSRYSFKGRAYHYDLGVNTECELTAASDDFIRETVTRTRRANSSGSGSGSGTHTGSSGTSHGGGGGGHRF